MNELFSQGGKGSAGILTNKQAVARHFGVKQSEVVYFSVGAPLTDYKVIYDKESQRAYSLPADIGSGVTAVSLSPAGVLVHSAGSVDLGALAVTREEYVTLPGSFDTGVTVNTKNELVVFTDGKYRWDGVLPKEVPAASTPEASGGIGDSKWVSVGESSLRANLSSDAVGFGDSLIATMQPINGSKIKTVHDWLSEHISIKDMANVTGDGVTDDALGINTALENLSSSGNPVVFVPGTYLINSNTTFNVPVTFIHGAVLKIRNGAIVKFNAEIDAGCYQIFDTEDDFVANYLTVPSVKIPTGPVRPEWFGAKTVNTYEELALSVDCADAFHKAWHATCGEFNVEVVAGSYYQSEYSQSYILLSPGKYRIDSHLKLWYRVTSPSTIRYNKNGGGMIGAGMGLSYIVLTNPSEESNAAIEFSDMSGEMHTFQGFKVTFYDFNASGDARWFGRTGAGLLISSSDSVYTYDIWAAGFKYLRTDANGVRRGGVGIQFESLVDHFFGNLLVEHCVNGVAFSSCVSNGTIIKGFSNLVSDLAFGNYIPAWPALITQTGINLVTLSGLESKACPATPIYFGTTDNRVSLTNVNIKGNGESSSTVVTYRAIAFNPASPGAGATGVIQGNVMNVNYGLIDDSTTGFAGRVGAPLKLDFNVYNVVGTSASETAIAVLKNPSSNVRLRLGVYGSLVPALISNCNYTVADLDLVNIQGIPAAPYSGFICSAGSLLITGLRASGTTAGNLGYAGNSSNVTLPALMSADVNGIRKGSGSSAVINQVSSATYGNIT